MFLKDLLFKDSLEEILGSFGLGAKNLSLKKKKKKELKKLKYNQTEILFKLLIITAQYVFWLCCY